MSTSFSIIISNVMVSMVLVESEFNVVIFF